MPNHITVPLKLRRRILKCQCDLARHRKHELPAGPDLLTRKLQRMGILLQRQLDDIPLCLDGGSCELQGLPILAHREDCQFAVSLKLRGCVLDGEAILLQSHTNQVPVTAKSLVSVAECTPVSTHSSKHHFAVSQELRQHSVFHYTPILL